MEATSPLQPEAAASIEAAKHRVIRSVRPPWPGWAVAALLVSGLVVVIVETTSILFFVGAFLLAVGVYGLVAVLRSPRPT
jgi:hypothetical protein